MNIIAHRRNTIPELQDTDPKYGIEVDIRSRGTDLIIHHDPFEDGALFDQWLDHFQHGTLILNIKEEGLETCLLERMKLRGIEDFFFLDQSFPFLVKTSRFGESRCAVRVSEFESIDTALTLAGKVEWVWIDCFSRFPLDELQIQKLREAAFKLVVVSPELHDLSRSTEIPRMKALFKNINFSPDAVCTKLMDAWLP